jgi:hypothetical protein
MVATAMLLVAGCITKDPDATPDDDDDSAECPEVEILVEDFLVEGQPWCGEPMPDHTTCFDCHLCAITPEASVNKQHYVCNYCHDGPSGEVTKPENAVSCGCDGLLCDPLPETLGCADCHTDGCNGYVSSQVQRDHCLFCHPDP